MEIEVYVYILHDAKGGIDWNVVADEGDNISIGGIDNKGNYQQYDSYEALIPRQEWARRCGMRLECVARKITV